MANDPQSLVTDGKCFFCYNLTEAQVMELQLLVNILQSGSMVPCTIPLPPALLTLNSSDATTIDLAVGIPIPGPTVGYVVRWGTTQGGPYPNSKSFGLSGSISVSTADGLVPGTLYYFVVYTYNGGNCLSATSSPELAAALDDPVTTAFNARLVVNGAVALTTAERVAVNNFVSGMKNDGIWDKMIAVNIFINKGLAGASTPLLVGGGFTAWGLTAYIPGNLNANGLLGVPASGTVLTTNLLPSSIFASKDDAGISCYISTNSTTAGYEVGRFGSVANSTFALSCNFSDTKTRFDAWENATLNGETQVASPNKAGFFSVSRTPSNTAKVYFANSTNAFAQVGATNNNAGFGTFSDVDRGITVGAVTTAGGTPLNNTDRRLSYVAIHFGLTSAQSQLEYNRVQALRVALGGGFI